MSKPEIRKIEAHRNVTDSPAFVAIAEATCGLPLGDVMQGLLDHLTQCIGMSTGDLHKAKAAARQLGKDMARTIGANWEDLQVARNLWDVPPAGRA